jgi:hypothetical protein
VKRKYQTLKRKFVAKIMLFSEETKMFYKIKSFLLAKRKKMRTFAVVLLEA